MVMTIVTSTKTCEHTILESSVGRHSACCTWACAHMLCLGLRPRLVPPVGLCPRLLADRGLSAAFGRRRLVFSMGVFLFDLLL